MRLLVMKQVGCAFVHVFLVLLAALALSGAPTQPAHADPQRLLAPDPPFEFTSHREISGSQLNAFNASLDLALTWNTFLGGSGVDTASSVKTDGSGNVYVMGQSWASWQGTYPPPVRPFTNDPGYSDVFVAKLSPNGTLLWHTFLGGIGSDYGSGLALDSSGNVYVTGSSYSTWGSPVRAYAGSQDAFVAKIQTVEAPTNWVYLPMLIR